MCRGWGTCSTDFSLRGFARHAGARALGKISQKPTDGSLCYWNPLPRRSRYLQEILSQRLRSRTFDRMFRWISCSSRTEDAAKMPEAIALKNVETESVLEGYRRWGYLAANLDPLG